MQKFCKAKFLSFFLLIAAAVYAAVPAGFAQSCPGTSDADSVPVIFLTDPGNTDALPSSSPERSLFSLVPRSLGKAFDRVTAESLFFRPVHLAWVSVNSRLGRSLYSPSRFTVPIFLTFRILLN